jgi:hypothetical protein
MRWVSLFAFLFAANAFSDDPLPVQPIDNQSTPATPATPAIPAAPAATDAEESAAAPVIPSAKPKRRGPREKEAEGTQAPNRFQADTVIKSQYKLDGQSLEVDPD